MPSLPRAAGDLMKTTVHEPYSTGLSTLNFQAPKAKRKMTVPSFIVAEKIV
jgi:hypothetical protein